MPNPLISVIIPVYNHYTELFNSLKFLVKQTIFKKIEIIVVDDGSNAKDASYDKNILTKLFPQILFFERSHQGAPAARNFGFKRSQGEFVIFWDADLEADKLFLEKLLTALQNNPENSYAYSSFKFGWKDFPCQKFNAQKLKTFNFIPMASLIRRGDFPGFDEDLQKFQDWDMWLTMLEKNKTGIWVPEFLFKANIRSNGLSSWLPSFLYKMPWLPLPTLKKYFYWKNFVLSKHKLKSV
ncbi:MAG: CapM [Candidatus Magasanikbacteria bacterium GW2011_GWC2_40_17]|uniref:CapM n=1 Tax=Candidatus Magasanikbacteria bacterium GW2011_GWA2_42_32 TaxID=1619039 RepID=A0A0G1A909_9BACT|nr:MAG: CapM [Candidatus Magasanikbacteria bacterium GW2011_GWC2_40_17]KKS57537.1 MAG: CapM [Candidatus Magasanikbacteria bacterium GW2011_GWA2_42_32]OGH85252.1 MAG: hypothetical protein A2294_00710 [Candidatus Magasanikbacteria bacterium RIFOXYB2_FULL_38_10]